MVLNSSMGACGALGSDEFAKDCTRSSALFLQLRTTLRVAPDWFPEVWESSGSLGVVLHRKAREPTAGRL